MRLHPLHSVRAQYYTDRSLGLGSPTRMSLVMSRGTSRSLFKPITTQIPPHVHRLRMSLVISRSYTCPSPYPNVTHLPHHVQRLHKPVVMPTGIHRQVRCDVQAYTGSSSSDVKATIQGCCGTISNGSRSSGFLRISIPIRSRALEVTCCWDKHGRCWFMEGTGWWLSCWALNHASSGGRRIVPAGSIIDGSNCSGQYMMPRISAGGRGAGGGSEDVVSNTAVCRASSRKTFKLLEQSCKTVVLFRELLVV